MPIPHGRSLTSWLRRYRAGAGGAITPQLQDVLTPAILVDDVRHLVPPFPVSQYIFAVNSANAAGERSGVEVIAGRAGSIVLGLEPSNNGFLSISSTGSVLPNNSSDSTPIVRGSSTGDALFTVHEGTNTSAALSGFFVSGAISFYAISANVLYAVPIFLPPMVRVVVFGNTDNVAMNCNFTVQDYPAT